MTCVFPRLLASQARLVPKASKEERAAYATNVAFRMMFSSVYSTEYEIKALTAQHRSESLWPIRLINGLINYIVNGNYWYLGMKNN
jgi:hypothetical protein